MAETFVATAQSDHSGGHHIGPGGLPPVPSHHIGPGGKQDQKEISIWWLETNSMISSMNIDNAMSESYLEEMNAQSKIVADMSQHLQELDANIQKQAAEDESASPTKLMIAAMVSVAVGIVIAVVAGPAGMAALGAGGAALGGFGVG